MAFLKRRNVIYAFVDRPIHVHGFAPNNFEKSPFTIAGCFFYWPK